MKEELTTKMHSEFEVDEETQRKHRVWNLLDYEKMNPKTTRADHLKLFRVTEEEVTRYGAELN